MNGSLRQAHWQPWHQPPQISMDNALIWTHLNADRLVEVHAGAARRLKGGILEHSRKFLHRWCLRKREHTFVQRKNDTGQVIEFPCTPAAGSNTSCSDYTWRAGMQNVQSTHFKNKSRWYSVGEDALPQPRVVCAAALSKLNISNLNQCLKSLLFSKMR